MMKKIEIKLIQHTPLLHFQSTQAGATLRASEVKPKLDKYLLSKGINRKDHPDWFVAKAGQDALDYKMRIEASDCNGYKGATKPMFFGRDKELVGHHEIKLTIFSLKEGLVKEIEEHITQFFLQTNFGTRQSKGYGSFTVDKGNSSDETIPENFFSSFTSHSTDWQQTMRLIDSFWKVVRGYLTKGYAKKLHTKREKELIQEVINDKHFDINNYNLNGYQDVKDYLGLSTEELWKRDFPRLKVTKICNGENRIERMQSPVLFKPVVKDNKYVVYIFIHDIPKVFRSSRITFNFKTKESDYSKWENEQKSFDLDVAKEFDLSDFMEFCINNYQSNPKNKNLNSVFKELKEQINTKK